MRDQQGTARATPEATAGKQQQNSRTQQDTTGETSRKRPESKQRACAREQETFERKPGVQTRMCHGVWRLETIRSMNERTAARNRGFVFTQEQRPAERF